MERLKKEHEKKARELEQQHFLFLTKKLAEHLPIEIPRFGSTVDYITKQWGTKRTITGNPNKGGDKSLSNRVKSKSELLLHWCVAKTQGYSGVKVTDYGNKSWGDGLAMAALVHSIRPDLIQFDSLSTENPAKNFKLAFDAAQRMGVAQILDAEMIVQNVERLGLITYLSEIYKVAKIEK